MQRFLTKYQPTDGERPLETKWYSNFKKVWGENRHSLHDGLYELLGRSVEQHVHGYHQLMQPLIKGDSYTMRVDYSWFELSDEEATALLLAYS